MTTSRQFGDALQPGEYERDLDAPSNTRYMRRIPILTGTEREARSDLLDVRYRARRPAWTVTAPTEPGWYWARASDQDVGMPVRVERFADGLRWSLGHAWQSVNLAGLLWSDCRLAEPGKD
jgi:hypothetical protein